MTQWFSYTTLGISDISGTPERIDKAGGRMVECTVGVDPVSRIDQAAQAHHQFIGSWPYPILA